MIKGLADGLRNLSRYNSTDRQFLTADQINKLGPFIKGSLELVQEMKGAHQEVLSKTKAQLDLDEEDMEKIKEDLAKIGKLANQTMELTGQLVEIFKDQATNVVKESSLFYWGQQLQNFNNITEDELLDSLCYFCDMVDNTSESQNQDTVSQLVQEYVAVLDSPHSESDDVKNTVAYGFGEFGYFLPKDKFAQFLPRACGLIKSITAKDGAFTDERIIATENAMGALAKLAYKQMDGTNVTEDDLIGILGQMPFKSDECESQKTHSILVAEMQDASSIVNTSANVKAAAVEAIGKIKQHIAEQGDDPDVLIVDAATMAKLMSM